MSYKQIAVDGPAVSGKSSAAKLLAQKLGWLYLDSGAIYRCITLSTLRGFQIKGEALFSRLDYCKISLKQNPVKPGCIVYINEEDVSEKIREQEVSDHILPISGDPDVRKWVTDFLRRAANSDNVVMDGRDIGSVVFPEAIYKFYMTASLESRTERRFKDLNDIETKTHTRENIYEMLKKRDEGDQNRKIAPLIQTADAILIDNSQLNLAETVDNMMAYLTKI
jgi:CMP/dCMP kinase